MQENMRMRKLTGKTMFDLSKLLDTEAAKAAQANLTPKEQPNAVPVTATTTNTLPIVIATTRAPSQPTTGNPIEALFATQLKPQVPSLAQPIAIANQGTEQPEQPEQATHAQLGDDASTIIQIVGNESDATILAKLAKEQLSAYDQARLDAGVITEEQINARISNSDPNSVLPNDANIGDSIRPVGQVPLTNETRAGSSQETEALGQEQVNNGEDNDRMDDNNRTDTDSQADRVSGGGETGTGRSQHAEHEQLAQEPGTSRDNDGSERVQDNNTPELPAPVNPLAPKGESLALKKVTLDASQIRAVNGALANTHVCIIGYAGTGKSTVVNNALEEALEDTERYAPIPLNTARYGDGIGNYPIPPIACVAYTGRATTQLKNKLDERLYDCASTIHAMLAYAPEPEERVQPDGSVKLVKIFKPRFTAHHKLPWKKIVIDEAGMVPANLWNEIIAACKPSTEIMLVGDIAQLPPIHGYSPLPLAMKHWPTYELTTIHRQTGSENTIPFNAQLIRNGSMPEWNKKDFIFETLPSSHLAARAKLVGIVKHLYNNKQFDPMQDAIISAFNVGHLGQEAINFELMTFFNPKPRIEVVGGISNILAAEGDKVMNTKNDLQAGINNGMLGIITLIEANDKFKKPASAIASGDMNALSDSDQLADIFALADVEGTEAKEKAASLTQKAASHKITVEFENGVSKIFSTAGDISNLTHAYAFTCHKSQGGEYRQVLVLAHSAHGGMLNREWFYTAVTRAQKRVMVIGDMKGLNGCLRNQAIKGNTLQEKAASIMAYCARKIAANEEDALPVIPHSQPIEGAKQLAVLPEQVEQHLDAKHQADEFFNKLLGLG